MPRYENLPDVTLKPAFAEVTKLRLRQAINEVRRTLIASGFDADFGWQNYNSLIQLSADLGSEGAFTITIRPVDKGRVLLNGVEISTDHDNLVAALTAAAQGLPISPPQGNTFEPVRGADEH